MAIRDSRSDSDALPRGYPEPMYVVAIRPVERAVAIGTRTELLGRGVVAREEYRLADELALGTRVAVQVRHRAPAVAAELVRLLMAHC